MKVFVACQLSSEKKLKFWDSLSYIPELPLCMIQYWPKCEKETVLHHYLLLFSLFYACLYLQTTSEGGVYRSGHTVLYGNVCEVNFLHSLRWFTETIGRLEKFRCRCSRHISQSLDLYSRVSCIHGCTDGFMQVCGANLFHSFVWTALKLGTHNCLTLHMF